MRDEEMSGDQESQAARQLGRKGGLRRASKLSKQRRTEIAKKAAKARWAKARRRKKKGSK